jgi:flagellar motor switch protein FliG
MLKEFTGSPHIINLQNLIQTQPAWKVAQRIIEENTQVGALMLAVASREGRAEILKQLPEEKSLKVIQALVDLRQPPEFVLSTVYDTLKKSFGT